jgi:IS5 family transposase
MEEALIKVPTMRRFAGIELISDRIPDETAILAFRHLLEKHELGEQIFETVKANPIARGMTMRQGTIVDATLIAAPSSTKNKDGKLDPEMNQTKKGNQCYPVIKAHNRSAEAKGYGVDKDSGLFHSVVTTAANVHNLTPAAELLHGDEEEVYGSGVQGCNAARQGLRAARHSSWKAPGVDRGCKGTRLCQCQVPIPGDQSAVRIPENRAARPGQEQLQNQCSCSSDESVPCTVTVTCSSVSKEWCSHTPRFRLKYQPDDPEMSR